MEGEMVEGLGKNIWLHHINCFLSPWETSRLRASSTFFRNTIPDKAAKYRKLFRAFTSSKKSRCDMIRVTCKNGYKDIILLMIKKGVCYIEEVMKIVFRHGYKDIVLFLIEKGVSICSYRGIYHICKGGYLDIAQLMIERELIIDLDWALGCACEYGNLDLVQLMIEKGATGLNWALRCAYNADHANIVQFLTMVKLEKESTKRRKLHN